MKNLWRRQTGAVGTTVEVIVWVSLVNGAVQLIVHTVRLLQWLST